MNPMLAMLGIDVEEFREKIDLFLNGTQETLNNIDNRLIDIQQRLERLEKQQKGSEK